MPVLSDYPIGAMIPVTDLARAKAFYTEKLGFKVIEEQDEGVQFESGGVRFDIYPTRVGAGAGATIAGWIVDNLDAEMEELRGRGVAFEDYDFPDLKTVNGVAEIEGFRGAWFKDSEGNVLAVTTQTKS
jgi:catechol 2,3-dioxygenase-like lactoylglutathione lyase family enzyme